MCHLMKLAEPYLQNYRRDPQTPEPDTLREGPITWEQSVSVNTAHG